MIQVYTGDGKGKTTAALGLALRAAGHSMKTLFIQFMKSEKCGYGEHRSLKLLYPYVDYRAFGRECFVSKDAPAPEDITFARQAFDFFKMSVKESRYRIYILDEACVALDYGLISEDEFMTTLSAIDKDDVELVVTGRYASERLIKAADLVTEFRELRHYYADSGLSGRKGIDF